VQELSKQGETFADVRKIADEEEWRFYFQLDKRISSAGKDTEEKMADQGYSWRLNRKP